MREKVDDVLAAPVGRRVAASLIDLILVAVPILWSIYGVYNLDDSWRPPLVLALGVVLLVAVTAWRGQYGYALGGWLMKVRTIRVGAPASPGIKTMAKRHCISAGTTVLFLAPVWSMLLDSSGQRRAWQDRAVGTRVIDTRWGVDQLAVAAAAEAEVASGETAEGSVGEFALARGRARPAVLASGVDMTPVLAASVAVGAGPYVPNLGARVRSGPDPAAFATPLEREPEAPVRMEREGVDLTVAPLPPAVPAAAGIEEGTASSVVLEFDSGERVTITGSGLIGRDPEPAPGQQVEHIVPLRDDTKTVSKTHVRIALVAGNLLIEDFHSTNGSAIEHSGARLPLVPGTPVPAPVGSTVHLGSRIFRVLAS